jgi:methyl-accepting chemotaxis protein
MATEQNESKRHTSISSKFNQSLLTLFLVLVLVLIPIMYYLTKTQVLAQANKELTLLVDMIKSVRNVVREDTRPHFTPKGEFFPVVVSSTVMAKTVASKFARIRPEYYIKIFSDNPLNADDYPDTLEKELLNRFRQNKQLKSIVETGTIQGQNYLLSAAPATVKKGCLLCHGDPARAPLAISKTYGTESGYGWTVGNVIGGIAVGVPLENINSIAVKRTLYALLALALVFGVLYIYINTIVRRSIIAPIREIADKAQKISHGDLGEALVTDRDDEIGELSNSFEMMRRSFISLVRRIKANNT